MRRVEDQRRRDVLTDGLPRGCEFAIRNQEAIVGPVGFSPEETPRDAEVAAVLPIPPPRGSEHAVLRRPIRRRRHREGVESTRDEEIQSRRSREEEQIQVAPSFQETAGEGDRARRMTQSLGMDREVAAQLLHQSAHGPGAERPSDPPGTCPISKRRRAARTRGRAALYSRRSLGGSPRRRGGYQWEWRRTRRPCACFTMRS